MSVTSRVNAGSAWSEWARQVPIPPFSAGLQFGISIFEGMQAHFTAQGAGYRILFTDLHYARLQRSASRLAIMVPTPEHFERGLHEAIEEALAEADAYNPESHRLYLRPLLFSGYENIFPRVDYPYFCSIFAKLIPRSTELTTVTLLADEPFFRATRGSGIGSAKCASNYTRIVEVQVGHTVDGGVQRVWLSPDDGATVEEADTMAIGLLLDDGRIVVPPPSATKLESITSTVFQGELARQGRKILQRKFTRKDLQRDIRDGRVISVFCVSTGKGFAIVEKIFFAEECLVIPRHAASLALWEIFQRIYE